MNLIGFFIKSISTVSLNKNHIITVVLWPFSIFTYFNIWFHSFWIEISAFCHITDINLYGANLSVILNFKIEPICMTFCISITAEEAVILIFLYPDDKIKISTLKCRIECMVCRYNFYFGWFFSTYLLNCFLNYSQV